MSPIMAKFMVMFVLTIFFLVLIAFSYLSYKVVLRPFIVRVFMYKKVLKTIEVINKSQGDPKKKIKDLIGEGICDLDLIKVAEIEILKSKSNSEKVIKEKSSKLSLLESLKIKWRNKSGKKKSVQQDSGKGSGRTKEKDAKPGDLSGTTSGDFPGATSRKRSVSGSTKFNSANAEQRPFQGESVAIKGKRARYFN